MKTTTRPIVLLIVAACVLSGCDGGSGNASPSSALITVDGHTSDWADAKPILRDAEGDVTRGVSGSDVVAVYMVVDSGTVYFRIDMANGTPAADVYVNVWLSASGDAAVDLRSIFIDPPVSRTQVQLQTAPSPDDWMNLIEIGTGPLVIRGSIIEFSAPFSILNPPNPSWVHVFVDDGAGRLDSTDKIVIDF